ncbi:hypothetical protein F5Y16DRAFT_411715 [Xylariaceae sp. FL0255]|nr:hypothetical protein F5Y16DRAFT_411715 [Xylariaceae sp. FL0255]
MATPGFLAQTQAQQYRAPAPSSHSTLPLSNGATKPIGTPFTSAPSPAIQVVIRCLPADTTEEKLRLMLLFSQELVDVEMMSPTTETAQEPALRSAMVKFKTTAGAQQAKEMLHGKSISSSASDVELIVDVIPGSPPASRRFPDSGALGQTNGPSPSSSAAAANPRQPSRFNDAFKTLDKITPPTNGLNRGNELPDPDMPTHYSSIFSPQSPIGNGLVTGPPRVLGKTLIRDTAEDDETSDLLKNPLAFAENGAAQHRRATVAQLPITQMANLSVNTNTNGSASLPQYSHSNMTPLSSHGNSMSPTLMNGAGHSMFYPNNPYPRHVYPPVNPADMNPPCNTLYVGNLPIDTSEEELKALFSQQRGYKRLCFRTKSNGPMCFVEFEDTTCATRTLHELYGKTLYNSVKGGIRLSFSKNPLGVRSGQAPGPSIPNGTMGSMNGIMAATSNGFPSANGPPPGLPAPPGFGRATYNPLNPSNMNGASNGFPTAAYPNGKSHGWGNSPFSYTESGPSPTPGSSFAGSQLYNAPGAYGSAPPFPGTSSAKNPSSGFPPYRNNP